MGLKEGFLLNVVAGAESVACGACGAGGLEMLGFERDRVWREVLARVDALDIDLLP